MTVMPTVCDPRLARVTDRALVGAVLWRLDLRDDGEHLILPDLSPDLVWTEDLPDLAPRTTSRLLLPAVRGTGAVGLRLPIAAHDVRIDPEWPGWATEDPRDREERSERLARAVRAGAVTWQVDDARGQLLRALDTPGVRIPQVIRQTGTSERTLRRTCHLWFGASPGTVAQVLRLWRFAHAVQRTGLAAAADEAGYADQSHASRDLRALTGLRSAQLAAWMAESSKTGPSPRRHSGGPR